MAPTLTVSYAVHDAGADAAALVTSSFTPANGEVIVVKATTWDAAVNYGTGPVGGSQTWTKRVEGATAGFFPYAVIWTTTVSGSPGSMTVSMTPSASSRHSMVVERWSGAQLAVSPAVNAVTSGNQTATSISLTTAAADSIVSWCLGDANSRDPATRAYLSSVTEEDVYDRNVSTDGVWYYAYQAAAVAGAQTFGLSAPSPMIWSTGGIEIQASAGGAPSIPIRPTFALDRGTVANATAATTSAVTLTSPTTIAVGNYLITRVAVDNSGASGAAPGCTVTDPRSNTWTVLGPALADPGAAAAGTTAYLCYAKVVTAYQAADALTFNWGGISTTAKAVVVEEWSYIHPTNPVAVAATTNDSGAAASTTAVTISRTPTGVDQLVYTCLATEGIAADTVGADSDTTNGSWSTLSTTASANATATNNQRVSGQYKVVTAAGAQSWDSTITSRDWAAVAVVFNPPDLPPRPYLVNQAAIVRSHYW